MCTGEEYKPGLYVLPGILMYMRPDLNSDGVGYPLRNVIIVYPQHGAICHHK